MVNALPRDEILETNRSVDGIFQVLDILSYLERNKEESLVPTTAPLYRPVSQVLRDFNAGKNTHTIEKAGIATSLLSPCLREQRKNIITNNLTTLAE